MAQAWAGWFALLSVLITHGLAQTTSLPDEAPPRISVRLYNYAEVSPGTLNRAKQEAHRILSAAGVESVWVDCPCSAAQENRYPACKRLPDTPAVLQVKILSRAMAKRLGRPRSEFGFAMLSDREPFAFNASVFAHRAEQLAQLEIASLPVILGHVLAHEVGHLLLGSGSHSRRGIMRVRWDKLQLRRASEGQLLFTFKQSRNIRAQAWKRARAPRAIAAKHREEPDELIPGISVRLHDHAGASVAEIAVAKREASRILGHAGQYNLGGLRYSLWGGSELSCVRRESVADRRRVANLAVAPGPEMGSRDCHIRICPAGQRTIGHRERFLSPLGGVPSGPARARSGPILLLPGDSRAPDGA